MYNEEIKEFLKEQNLMDANIKFYDIKAKTKYLLLSTFLELFMKFLRRKSLLK